MRTFLIALTLLYSIVLYGQYRSQVWCPDNGDGTYTNPVLYADYSDPDICVVGEDYYLTASSFNCIPGLPILHSKDLVNWEIIGYALQEQEPKELFDKPQHGKGVWAPAIRHHNDSLYIYWGDPDLGIFMVKTFLSPLTSHHTPLNWSKPTCVIAGKGMIDPCPATSLRCVKASGLVPSSASLLNVRNSKLAVAGWMSIG